MTKKEIVEYLERYQDDVNLVILIANIKDRVRHGIKEYGFLFDDEIECPVLCIEVDSGEDMDEFMISACKECEAEEHNGEATEMVMTNADRIRSMTDEELAKFLEAITCESNGWCEDCPSIKGNYCNGLNNESNSLVQERLEWLKSEVGCE